jgi:hypothetical protein
VRSWPVPGNKRLRRLEWVLGKKLGVAIGTRRLWDRELSGGGGGEELTRVIGAPGLLL